MAEQATLKIKRLSVCYKAKMKSKQNLDSRRQKVLKKVKTLALEDSLKAERRREDEREAVVFRENIEKIKENRLRES